MFLFLLYFTCLLFVYHPVRFTLFFWNHLLQLAKTILQLSIQILKITVYFVKRKSVQYLHNIASIQYHYLRMITSKEWLRRIVNITLKKLFPSALKSSALSFTELVFIFVSISEQQI